MLTKVLIAIILLVVPVVAMADMEYEIGYVTSFYEGNQHGFRAQAGNTSWPVYGWVGYEPTELRVLGQGVGDADMVTAGIGASHSWGDFSVFIDFGYAMLDLAVKQNIVDEIVYTDLVNNHNATDSRPIPAADPTRPHGFGGQDLRYHPDDARTSYDIDNGFLGRVGVGFQVHEHIKLTASYRYLTPKEHLELWDIHRRANDGGYWVENREKDLSAFEMGIIITF